MKQEKRAAGHHTGLALKIHKSATSIFAFIGGTRQAGPAVIDE
jgi:hypothetical protein